MRPFFGHLFFSCFLFCSGFYCFGGVLWGVVGFFGVGPVWVCVASSFAACDTVALSTRSPQFLVGCRRLQRAIGSSSRFACRGPITCANDADIVAASATRARAGNPVDRSTVIAPAASALADEGSQHLICRPSRLRSRSRSVRNLLTLFRLQCGSSRAAAVVCIAWCSTICPRIVAGLFLARRDLPSETLP